MYDVKAKKHLTQIHLEVDQGILGKYGEKMMKC